MTTQKFGRTDSQIDVWKSSQKNTCSIDFRPLSCGIQNKTFRVFWDLNNHNSVRLCRNQLLTNLKNYFLDPWLSHFVQISFFESSLFLFSKNSASFNLFLGDFQLEHSRKIRWDRRFRPRFERNITEIFLVDSTVPYQNKISE